MWLARTKLAGGIRRLAVLAMLTTSAVPSAGADGPDLTLPPGCPTAPAVAMYRVGEVPLALDAEQELAMVRDCEAALGAVLSDAMTLGEGRWNAYPSATVRADAPTSGWSFEAAPGQTEPEAPAPTTATTLFHFAQRGFAATLQTPQGAGVNVTGIVSVSTENLVAVGATAGGLIVPGLELLAAQQLVAWPEGWAGLYGGPSEAVGSGRLWRSDRPLPDRVLNPDLGSSWPRRVASWSDGRLWLLHIGLVFPETLSSKWVRSPVDIALGPATPDDRWRRLHYVVSSMRAFEVVDSGHHAPTAPSDRALVLVQTWLNRLPLADRSGLAQVPVGGTALPVPIPLDGWLRAPQSTDATEPYLWWPGLRAWGPRVGDSWSSGVCGRCTAGNGTIALTAWPAEDGRMTPAGTRADESTCRATSSRWLAYLLGGVGQSLGLVPMASEPLAGHSGYVLTPDPDHRIGWEGEIRVGDTPWGRCRIYIHPAILHVVFDLSEQGE